MKKAQLGWDTGVTSTMVQASYDYIDFLQSALSSLAVYYPPKQFDETDPRHFFSAVTAGLFKWYWAVLEPKGPGTGGTIVRNLTCGSVTDDLEKMLVEMVMALGDQLENFDFKMWRAMWRNELGD